MSHFCLFFSFPWMCIRIKWGYVLHILCGLLLGWTCLHAVSILECFFTPNSLLVTVGDTMRGMGSFPCPQEPVVWVRDHLLGILLSSMGKGVLALCLSPAADTATASEFFHQEKKKITAAPIHSKLIWVSREVQFHIIEVCRGSSQWACGPKTHTHRIK